MPKAPKQQPIQAEPCMTPEQALQRLINREDEPVQWWIHSDDADEHDGYWIELTLAEYNVLLEVLACKRGVTVAKLREGTRSLRGQETQHA